MTTRRPSPWRALPDRLKRSISETWRYGVPAEATALYGRWWQLETWLRSLLYVELRAHEGVDWAAALPSSAEEREVKDRRQSYMSTPDQIRLAYLDVAPLLDLLTANWSLFADSLIDDKDVWSGRVVELRKIRNRIGHCRRPHLDDLARLEQTLRDLDPGALRAVTAFNRQRVPSNDLADPLVEAWVRNQHEDAARLVIHAHRQYEVRFVLRYSRRRWADSRPQGGSITGNVGYLWHATWYLRQGYLDLGSFWQDSYLDSYRDLIVFVCANSPTVIGVSFAAVDEAKKVADAIGNCFDALLSNQRWGELSSQAWDTWPHRHADLDFRVQVNTPWSVIEDNMGPMDIFGA